MVDQNPSYTQDPLSPKTAATHPVTYLPISYFGISIRRLVCLFILTMGLYRYYWAYKNWKAVQQAENSDISPFWRSFFGIFFCHGLFKYLAESVKNHSSKRPFSPTRLAVWYIILHVIGLGFFKIILLIKAQRAVLFNNAQLIPNYKPIKQYTRAEIIWIIVGIILWVLGIGRAIASEKRAQNPPTHVSLKAAS